MKKAQYRVKAHHPGFDLGPFTYYRTLKGALANARERQRGFLGLEPQRITIESRVNNLRHRDSWESFTLFRRLDSGHYTKATN